MIPLSAHEIAAVTSAQLVFGSLDVHASSVATDSRFVEPSSAFFAIVGERSDGHHYLLDAVERGASVLFITDEDAVGPLQEVIDPERVAVLLGSDPLTSVQLLAAHQRASLQIPVIGITGSTGKTSTKQFVTAVLQEQLSVVSTYENQNNELGCPLTVLRADASTEALVVEMGMRGRGQISELAAISRPTIGIVTNIGPVHIEHLGSVESIAYAKGELLEALAPEGLALVEAEGAYSDLLLSLTEARIMTVGSSPQADVRGEVIRTAVDGTVEALVSSRTQLFDPFELNIPIAGAHHLTNTLFAVAVGVELGIPVEAIAKGIRRASIPGMRFSALEVLGHGVTVINDAYNANPTSMGASLETFMTVQPARPHYAVIGDMLELGAHSEYEHRLVGELCADLGLDGVFSYGDAARCVAESARNLGIRAAHYEVTEMDRLRDDLWGMLHRGDYLLIKGSRGMALERVLDGLDVVRESPSADHGEDNAAG